MVRLKILKVGDPGDELLRENLLQGPPVTPEQVLPLARPMRELCRRLRGLGLAAPQVGLRLPFFFMGAKVMPMVGEFVLNPRIAPEQGLKMVPGPEGCLSLPGGTWTVKRHPVVWLTFMDLKGTERTVRLAGLPAIVAQHETDHLRGLLIDATGKPAPRA